jgi:glycine cleavage system H lipoate-binding protein
MEASSVDIFATNGIEYVLIIGFLFSLIFFWRLLNASAAPSNTMPDKGKSGISANPQFVLAEDYYFHPGHSWAIPEKQNIVRVGIDDFAQQLLGRPDVVELPKIGSHIEQGKKGWGFQIDSKIIDILSPVDGEVIAINNEVIGDPSYVNQDPYGGGWLVKVKVSKINENLGKLLSGELASACIK